MIPRYSLPEMASIWQDEYKYKLWFEVEYYVCEAQTKLGLVPKEDLKSIFENGSKAIQNIDIDRILDIEKTVKHDVIAFLTWLAENVGPSSRFIHQGMTSSDLLDTCFSLQLSRAADLLIEKLNKLLTALKKRALEHKNTACVGRSHGIHAEPTSFGLKLAGFYTEFKRNLDRLIRAKEEISVCALSGAVGNYSTLDPSIEEYVAKKLNFKTEDVSTQVIPRDRHAMFFSTLAVIASSIERLAVEIRHLQRSEVLEAEENFSKGQKGSSAMPHKRNPILSENLTGLARMVRSYALPALENVALWHERDISHSSVERMIAPDATVTLDFALHRLAGVVENLKIYPTHMERNLEHLQGLIHSQKVLLKLIEKGLSREDSYAIVQMNAMQTWEKGLNFKSLIENDTDVQSLLDEKEIEEIFSYEPHLKNIDLIFDKIF